MKALAELQPSLPKDIRIQPELYSQKAFIDRVLVAVEREGLKATLLINKLDLAQDEEFLVLLGEDLAVYEELGYEVCFLSAQLGVGVEELRARLKVKVAVFTGPSGVGKSTLLNALYPSLELRTGEVGKLGKGRHVTSAALLIPIPGGGWVVDTPGIKDMGLHGLYPDDLILYYPELADVVGLCRFGDCTHSHEPGCVVKEAVENGRIAQWRYDNYVNLYDILVEAA